MGLMQPRSELKNQDVPSEDYKLVLHKYKESTSSIAIYLVGYKICTKSTTYKMFIELARFLQDMASGGFFLFLFGSFCFLPLFSFGTLCFLFFFTPTSFDANTRYMIN
jgi:hypothetical protein